MSAPSITHSSSVPGSKGSSSTSRTGTPYSGPMAPSSAGRRVTVVGDSIALGAAPEPVLAQLDRDWARLAFRA